MHFSEEVFAFTQLLSPAPEFAGGFVKGLTLNYWDCRKSMFYLELWNGLCWKGS